MNDLISISIEAETLAGLMVEYNGNLKLVSRAHPEHNLMSLKQAMVNDPRIRMRYTELLAEKLNESGLHITERILQMVELQEIALGRSTDEDGNDIQLLPDVNAAIAISKEISRLIAEAKGQNVTGQAAIILVSKEGAADILSSFLDS